MHKATTLVRKTSNRKVGAAAITHASQSTCGDCPFEGNGCYAESGPMAWTTNRLNAVPTTGAAAAQQEADSILDYLQSKSVKRDMRLHGVGDCSTDSAAQAVSAAADVYSYVTGKDVWSYTHSWADVLRRSWGRVSVLASVETIAAAKRAMRRGYAAAMVVVLHPTDGKSRMIKGIKLIPCPSQTRNVKCTDCRLCFDDASLLKRKAVITFAAHGGGAKRIKAALRRIAA